MNIATGKGILSTGLLGLFLATGFSAKAQQFEGFRSGRFAGVQGLLNNPASGASSYFKWDVNLLSIHGSVQNNNAKFSLSDFNSSFDSDVLDEQLTGENADPTNALLSVDILGPSAMFRIGKAGTLGITTRARGLVNIEGIDGTLINQFADGDITYPTTFNINGEQRGTLNGWTEIGLSYSRKLYSNQKLDLYGGVTVKIMGSDFNGYLSGNNVSGALDEDASGDEFLTNTNGSIGFAFGGTSFEEDNISFFNFGTISPGFDLGAQLELKGNQPKYKGGYQVKFGLSILDIGSLKYESDPQRSGAYNINIGANQRFYVNEFENVELDDIKTVFENNPQYFNATSGGQTASYNVSLPTRLLADVDYNLTKGWFINLMGQVSLAATGSSKPYNPSYYSGFALTPRFERGTFGFWLPIQYNEISSFNAGIGLKLGPLYIGSGSFLTALLGESRQADAYIGLRFGGRGSGKMKK